MGDLLQGWVTRRRPLHARQRPIRLRDPDRRNGNVRIDTDVDGEVSFARDRLLADGARFRFGDNEYEFLPDERGRMPDLGPIPNPQVDGRWRRVGDTREPDVWFAWGEAVPANGHADRADTTRSKAAMTRVASG